MIEDKNLCTIASETNGRYQISVVLDDIQRRRSDAETIVVKAEHLDDNIFYIRFPNDYEPWYPFVVSDDINTNKVTLRECYIKIFEQAVRCKKKIVISSILSSALNIDLKDNACIGAEILLHICRFNRQLQVTICCSSDEEVNMYNEELRKATAETVLGKESLAMGDICKSRIGIVVDDTNDRTEDIIVKTTFDKSLLKVNHQYLRLFKKVRDGLGYAFNDARMNALSDDLLFNEPHHCCREQSLVVSNVDNSHNKLCYNLIINESCYLFWLRDYNISVAVQAISDRVDSIAIKSIDVVNSNLDEEIMIALEGIIGICACRPRAKVVLCCSTEEKAKYFRQKLGEVLEVAK